MNTPAPTQVEPMTEEEIAEIKREIEHVVAYVTWASGPIKRLLATITQLQAEIARLKESSQADTGTSEGPLDGERSQDYYDSLHADAMATEAARLQCNISASQARADMMTTDKFPVGSRVRKIEGYPFGGDAGGTVLGTFSYDDDRPPFVNVKHPEGWVMHFRENILELIAPASQADTAHGMASPRVTMAQSALTSLPPVSTAPGEDDDDRGGVRSDLVKAALDFVHVEFDPDADIDDGIVQALAAHFETIDHRAEARGREDAVRLLNAAACWEAARDLQKIIREGK